MSATPPQPEAWQPQHRAPDEPTPGQLEQLGDLDRSGRIGRTTVQVGTPSAVIVIATWAARLAGLDLDPGPGTDMPAVVAAAWVAIASVALALAMNRRTR